MQAQNTEIKPEIQNTINLNKLVEIAKKNALVEDVQTIEYLEHEISQYTDSLEIRYNNLINEYIECTETDWNKCEWKIKLQGAADGDGDATQIQIIAANFDEVFSEVTEMLFKYQVVHKDFYKEDLLKFAKITHERLFEDITKIISMFNKDKQKIFVDIFNKTKDKWGNFDLDALNINSRGVQ